MEEFVQQVPANLIIPSSQLRMLDITLGQGTQYNEIPLKWPPFKMLAFIERWPYDLY